MLRRAGVGKRSLFSHNNIRSESVDTLFNTELTENTMMSRLFDGGNPA